MDKILSFKRYICGYEEFNFSELYRRCDIGIRKLPINAFLLEHKKKGHILINTGCSSFLKKNPVAFTKLTSKHKLSFEEKDSISAQLLAEGMDPVCIRKVLLTHCDPECCASLPLLPKYELLSSAKVLSLIWLSDPSDGIMKSTVPSEEVPKKAAGLYQGETFLKQYFKWVYDVFGDGTILAVDITGHAKAMTAFYLTEKNIFIAADASVDETAVAENLVPSDKLLKQQFYPDDYLSVLITLRRIKKEHPEIQFIFSHSEKI
ncbi:MAG: hypothetical protein IJ192_08745 [Clostridia bacterium]|nr:hypothetical protein [Clostridia bacterium]